MVVGVLVVRLDDVVVDVLDANLGLHPIQAHRLQLKHHQRAGGVLGQGLVDPEPNRGAGRHLTLDQMAFNEFLSDVLRHKACLVTLLVYQ